MSRIDSGTILVAFFAILFGLIGAFLLRKSLQSKNVVAKPPPEVRRGPTKVTVPLASRNLQAGTQITLDDVALFKLSRAEMKEHGIKTVFMSNPDQIIGKTVAVNLKRGSTFDTKDFYAPGTGPGIADKLELGQRAVTIDVSATSALLGFAGAGQSVDVLFHYGQSSGASSGYDHSDWNNRYNNDRNTWHPPHFDYNPTGSAARADRYNDNFDHRYGHRGNSSHGNKYQNATVTLVQKATILALGRRVNQTGNSSQLDSEDRVRVTLAVKPESAERIRVAEGHGELSLTLRGYDDDEVIEKDQPATLASIIKIEEPPQPPRREVRDMDIYRGQNRSQVQFTRDRDTGYDDFQKWVLLKPAPEENANDPSNPNEQSHTAPPKPNLGRPNGAYFNNSPNGILIEDKQSSQRQRLQSDFRKIRTLFNQEPDLRDRNQQDKPNNPPLNINAPNPNESNDLSSSKTAGEVRSAKAIELYDPRSWE